MFLGPTLLIIMILVLAVIKSIENIENIQEQNNKHFDAIKQQVDHQIILDAKRNEYMKNGIQE